MVGEIRVDDACSGSAAAAAGLMGERTIAAIKVGVTPFDRGRIMNEGIMSRGEPEKEIGDGCRAAVKSVVTVREGLRGWISIKDGGERSNELSVGIYDFADDFAVIYDVALRRHGRNES